MYLYVEEYCKPYRQFMPVEYKKIDGKWIKTNMAGDKCGQCTMSLNECKHFQIAPQIALKEQLREEKIK